MSSLSTSLIYLLPVIIVVGIPAWFVHRYVIKLVQPKKSFWRLLAYFLITLASAFVFAFIAGFVLLKFAYTTK